MNDCLSGFLRGKTQALCPFRALATSLDRSRMDRQLSFGKILKSRCVTSIDLSRASLNLSSLKTYSIAIDVFDIVCYDEYFAVACWTGCSRVDLWLYCADS